MEYKHILYSFWLSQPHCGKSAFHPTNLLILQHHASQGKKLPLESKDALSAGKGGQILPHQVKQTNKNPVTWFPKGLFFHSVHFFWVSWLGSYKDQSQGKPLRQPAGLPTAQAARGSPGAGDGYLWVAGAVALWGGGGLLQQVHRVGNCPVFLPGLSTTLPSQHLKPRLNLEIS